MFHFSFLILFLLSLFFCILHLIVSIIVSKPKKTFDDTLEEDGISILIPCFNETKILHTSISGLLELKYVNFEVIFINDGSTDMTMETLHQLLDLVPAPIRNDNKLRYKAIKGFYKSQRFSNFYVINKDNGGKADSLNAGIDFSTKDLIITLDADSILKANALMVTNNVFADKKVVAAGGLVSVLQGLNCNNVSLKRTKNIVRFQILEYMKGFFVLKTSLAKMNALQVISGAFGIFNKDLLLKIGGYRETIGEDIDITIRINQSINKSKEKKMVFIPEAVCYTECPENWKDLLKQRIRWQKAFIDCLFEYGSHLIKEIGKTPLSFFMLFDSFITGTVATFFTMASIIFILFLPFLDKSPLLIYIIVSISASLIYNIVALIISNRHQPISIPDRLYLTATVFLDVIIWRIINCIFIISGTILYFFNKTGWNKVERTGKVYDFQNNNLGSFSATMKD